MMDFVPEMMDFTHKKCLLLDMKDDVTGTMEAGGAHQAAAFSMQNCV